MPETYTYPDSIPTHPDFRSTPVTRRREVQAKNLEMLAQQLELPPINPIEYIRTVYRDRYTRELIPVIELTKESERQITSIRDTLFGDHLERILIPVGNDFDFSAFDKKKQNFKMNGLLATSLIRRRTGGYVCSFTDDFQKLSQQEYLARVLHVNENNQTARIQFDHWPVEYLTYKYVEEKPHYVGINNPLTIGPECVVPLQYLRDGKPHENIWLWAKNVVQRNNPFT